MVEYLIKYTVLWLWEVNITLEYNLLVVQTAIIKIILIKPKLFRIRIQVGFKSLIDIDSITNKMRNYSYYSHFKYKLRNCIYNNL